MKYSLALLISSLPALANSPLTQTQQVAELIQLAQQQVVVTVPRLESPTVANALRLAATQRGIQVYLLVEQRHVLHPASYTAALSLLPRINVFLTRAVTQPLILIDQQLTIRGPLTYLEAAPGLPVTVWGRGGVGGGVGGGVAWKWGW